MMKKFLCSLLVFIIIITSSAIAFSKRSILSSCNVVNSSKGSVVPPKTEFFDAAINLFHASRHSICSSDINSPYFNKKNLDEIEIEYYI